MIGEKREGGLETLPVGLIRPRSLPVRAEPSDREIDLLADSIRVHGLIHPILVRPSAEGYEVVCGERRLRAFRKLRRGEIPATVRPLDDRRAMAVAVAENVHRGTLSAPERARAVEALAEAHPGRDRGEIEAWVGSVPAASEEPSGEIDLSALGEPLPGWLSELPETESPETVSVVLSDAEKPPAGSEETTVVVDRDTQRVPVVVRRTLLGKVRRLLNGLSRGGRLNEELLDEIVAELFRRRETLPPHEFLALRTQRTKRYVSRHCLNVAKLAMVLARETGMAPEQVRQVTICALLHDVGMMKVKDEVFTKHASLDPEEWEDVKGHPVEGSMLLTKEVVLRDVVARVALEHHERPDGSGYPEGKTREEIHAYARLINVVDAYGAMVSPRAHRLPRLPHEAMQVVMDDGAKGMLDWELVQAFVRALSIYPVGSWLRLENGEVAQVVRASPDIPAKPVIAVVADGRGTLLEKPVEIDLAMTEPQPSFEAIPAPY